jgi:hypothetical protein
MYSARFLFLLGPVLSNIENPPLKYIRYAKAVTFHEFIFVVGLLPMFYCLIRAGINLACGRSARDR